jgi:transposase
MISFENFCQIRDYHQRQHLNAEQIAQALNLHRHTVVKWLNQPHYHAVAPSTRASKLDAFKGDIARWLEQHPYSAAQIFQRLREHGYEGGYGIVKQYVRQVRPARSPAYLKLAFAPGECAQLDWGSYGTIPIGSTRRRLSFFVMVLCYSRLMYLEFTVLQTMEHFLNAHENAFQAFSGVPKTLMVDNLKSAVLLRPLAEAPVFNPRYLDLARHFGFTIKPCGVGKGNEKGRVENGVGYVKKNFLNGLEIHDLSSLNLAARQWLDTVANVRIHGETRQRPLDLWQTERPQLQPLNPQPFDSALIKTVRASNQFRVSFDGNRYSVPAEYASAPVQLKAYPERLCLYAEGKLIARHQRCYDRHQDIEDPDHPRALLVQRRKAREQKLLARCLTLSPQAEAYYLQLSERRLDARRHIEKIVALSEIYGVDALARALADALHFQAFSSDYIANLLAQRAHYQAAEPVPLNVPRAGDQLELDLPLPDLSLYDDPESDS